MQYTIEARTNELVEFIRTCGEREIDGGGAIWDELQQVFDRYLADWLLSVPEGRRLLDKIERRLTG